MDAGCISEVCSESLSLWQAAAVAHSRQQPETAYSCRQQQAGVDGADITAVICSLAKTCASRIATFASEDAIMQLGLQFFECINLHQLSLFSREANYLHRYQRCSAAQ